MNWRRKRREVMSTNPFWTYRKDLYVTDTGAEGEYHYASTKGSVLVIPQREDGRFVLVRQYRYLQEGWCLEFPGGAQEVEKTPAEMAAIELREETGYAAGSLISLGWFAPCIGLVDERCEVFWARDVVEKGAPQPEEMERLEQILLTAEEIEDAIRTGEMSSGMSLSVWTLFQLKHRTLS